MEKRLREIEAEKKQIVKKLSGWHGERGRISLAEKVINTAIQMAKEYRGPIYLDLWSPRVNAHKIFSILNS